MLRAVLSPRDCDRVTSRATVTYVGEQFPAPAASVDSRDFAVLRVGSEETTPQWRSGFYRLDSDLMELNQALRDLSL